MSRRSGRAPWLSRARRPSDPGRSSPQPGAADAFVGRPVRFPSSSGAIGSVRIVQDWPLRHRFGDVPLARSISWLARLASAGPSRYRIPRIADDRVVAPKGPRQISPGQSVAPPWVRRRIAAKALKGRHKRRRRLFRPFRACFRPRIRFPGRRRRSHDSRRLALGWFVRPLRGRSTALPVAGVQPRIPRLREKLIAAAYAVR